MGFRGLSAGEGVGVFGASGTISGHSLDIQSVPAICEPSLVKGSSRRFPASVLIHVGRGALSVS